MHDSTIHTRIVFRELKKKTQIFQSMKAEKTPTDFAPKTSQEI